MILSIICAIFAALGIYGFYAGNNSLLIIGCIIAVIETIYGLFNGELKSLGTTIFSMILGIIFTSKVWMGICIGICFENVIMLLFGLLLIFIIGKKEN